MSDPEFEALKAKLQQLTVDHPREALFSVMEVLIDIACGENPALRDYKRKMLYVGILSKLKAKGIT